LLCNMTVTLLWKCNELIVTQQELLRYYSNATTDLTCHNIKTSQLLEFKSALFTPLYESRKGDDLYTEKKGFFFS
jgi:predicted transglutaminase-like protease